MVREKSQMRREIKENTDYRFGNILRGRIYDKNEGIYIGDLRGNGYFHDGRWKRIGEIHVDLTRGDIKRKESFIEWCISKDLPVWRKEKERFIERCSYKPHAGVEK